MRSCGQYRRSIGQHRELPSFSSVDTTTRSQCRRAGNSPQIGSAKRSLRDWAASDNSKPESTESRQKNSPGAYATKPSLQSFLQRSTYRLPHFPCVRAHSDIHLHSPKRRTGQPGCPRPPLRWGSTHPAASGRASISTALCRVHRSRRSPKRKPLAGRRKIHGLQVQ